MSLIQRLFYNDPTTTLLVRHKPEMKLTAVNYHIAENFGWRKFWRIKPQPPAAFSDITSNWQVKVW